MSYAEAAAKGPKQSPEELRRAPAPPTIEHSGSPSNHAPDVDSPHISSVTSDFSEMTSTAEDRMDREARDAEEEARKAFGEAETSARTHFDAAEKEFEKAKSRGQAEGKKAKGKAKEWMGEAEDNKDNPVVVGNAVVLGLGTAALGYGAYRKYSAGELNWKVAGVWGGIVGLFCVGDYYFSQWLFRNKYPRK